MEVEVKAIVRDEDALVEKLHTLGCELSNPVLQDDTVWVENVGNLDIFLNNKVFMRIRKQNDDTVLLTAKKSKRLHGNESLVKHEYEVTINSVEQAQGMLHLLGFTQAVQVIKKRQIAHYKDIEICLDEVEGLGTFIELEKIVPENEAEKTQQELYALLAQLEVIESDIVRKGYDILMLEKFTVKASR